MKKRSELERLKIENRWLRRQVKRFSQKEIELQECYDDIADLTQQVAELEAYSDELLATAISNQSTKPQGKLPGELKQDVFQLITELKNREDNKLNERPPTWDILIELKRLSSERKTLARNIMNDAAWEKVLWTDMDGNKRTTQIEGKRGFSEMIREAFNSDF